VLAVWAPAPAPGVGGEIIRRPGTASASATPPSCAGGWVEGCGKGKILIVERGFFLSR
jgi:hypothetical protein